MEETMQGRRSIPLVMLALLILVAPIAAWGQETLLAIENPEKPTLGGDDLFGTSVAVASGKILVGAPRDDPNGISNAGSAYLIDLATGAVTPLRKPSPAPGEMFGTAVAATERPAGDPRGPGFDFLVGVPQDHTAGPNGAGAAYLFDGTTGALLLTIRKPAPGVNDRFGSAVAGADGVLVIGAPLADVGAVSDAGSVYVYDASHRDNDGHGPVLPILTIPNPEPTQGDQFGAAVAAAGADPVVGVPFDDPVSVSNGGSVYRFPGTRRNGDGLGAVLPSATIRKAVPVLDDQFGFSVAASDGTIFIGVPAEEEGPILNAGAVYAYVDGAGLTRFPNPDPDTNDNFGAAVAASDQHVVVGTPGDDLPGAANAGSVYLLSGVTGALVRTLANPDAAENDDFGRSVAAAAGTFVAGAPRDDLLGTGKRNAGSGYVFGVTDAVVKVPNPEEPTLLSGDDQFGYVVAAIARGPGDPRGPGLDAIVGAPNDDPLGILDAGSVYLFDGDTGDLILTIPNPEPTEADQFGFSVIGIDRPAGDFRGPGQDILVGAMLDSPAGVFQAGSAFLFDSTRRDGDGLGPVLPILTIRNPDTDPPLTFDHFGAVVGALGNRIIVTAMFADEPGAPNTGALYVFAGLGGGPGSEPPGALLLTVRNPDPNPGDNFAAWSVKAVDRAPNDPRGPGKDILTGAMADDPDPDGSAGSAARVADAGTAYLVDGDTGAILLTIPNPDLALPDPDGAGPLPHPARSDRFGFSVAADGTRLIISAFQDRVGNADSAGTVYVFDGTRRDGDGLGPVAPLLAIRNPYPGNNDLFGWAVDVLGGDIIVGTMQDSDPDGATGPEPAAFQQGSAFLFDGLTGELLRIIADPDPDDPGTPHREFDHFGTAVAAFGNRILIGAMYDDTETIRNEGAAYLYARENVRIDVKPGSFPNSINLGSKGKVAVAIFGSPSIDAAAIDPLSVTLAGAQVARRGNGTLQVSLEDLDGDGFLDLVGHVPTQALKLTATSTRADVRGRLVDGTPILGRDSVRVIRD